MTNDKVTIIKFLILVQVRQPQCTHNVYFSHYEQTRNAVQDCFQRGT